ncbi:hypothetical protein BCR37DRAFT_389553 [Protomyces lactucae-debilis]|uniref:Uncharacterized protein n=1 Tax=Protomyces lactucae-debilis TaxID=2754530 RepID=A0A1Y2EVY0_PROLT|nr:uncharacterized protein BCR37DRAFT_389553 [Protomyces lactucae-debilis]ORY75718.1 hypothetical protein BCR37DRAFT_389553 [Protomyces lactucae-debilis]
MAQALTAKDKALKRLQEGRAVHNEYKAAAEPTESLNVSNTPILYYTVHDANFRQVNEGVVYAHSLEELFFQAIDNADRIGSLDALFSLRPDFTPRNLTIRDLVLTSFVGSDDGNISSLLCCPYTSDKAFEADTSLSAICMSEFVPNTRDSPLRISVNSTSKNWSAMKGLSLFGPKSDKLLIELNERVNKRQIVALRNDPEGCIRYSKASLQLLAEQKEKEAAEQAAADAAERGTEADSEGGSKTDSTTLPTAVPVASSTTEAAEDATTTATKAPVRPKPVSQPSAYSLAAISGPLRAAKNEDNVRQELDADAISANVNHPAFEEAPANDESPREASA